MEEWRFEESLAITKERRPDLYEKFVMENPEIMEARRKRIERMKRLEERRRKREQQKEQQKEEQQKGVPESANDRVF